MSHFSHIRDGATRGGRRPRALAPLALVGVLAAGALTAVTGPTAPAATAPAATTPAATRLAATTPGARSVPTGLSPAPAAAQAAPAGVAARRPVRRIRVRLSLDSRQVVTIRGAVQRWPGGRVVIQRRRCLRASCPWRFHGVTRSGPRTHFHARIYAPRRGRLYWRAAVRPAGDFRLSARRAWGYTYLSR